MQATGTQLADILRFLIQTTGNEFLQAVEDAELSLTQLKALHVLADDEELSLNGMAERLGGLSLPTVSRAVDSLVQRGYVRRTEDAADRRMKRVSLTAKGRRTIDKLVGIRAAEFERALESMTDDQRDQLARALEPILERRS